MSLLYGVIIYIVAWLLTLWPLFLVHAYRRQSNPEAEASGAVVFAVFVAFAAVGVWAVSNLSA